MSSSKVKTLLIFFTQFLFSAVCGAQDVSDINEYPEPKAIEVVKVRAHISRVNHALLRQDYPFMKAWSDTKIETWISENLNLLARAQAQQSQANTPIAYDAFKVTPRGQRRTGDPYVSGVFRPAGYGRAFIIEVYDPVANRVYYFDGKGLGADKPMPLPHKTGLASFGEANREITMSTLVDTVLKHARTKFSAIQSYFQFQFEFDMIEQMENGSSLSSRAGAVFRQNHIRPIEDPLGSADPEVSIEVERVLRKYGITSAGASFDDEPRHSDFLDITNVQITRNKTKLYDFGGYLVESVFTLPLIEWDVLVDYLKAHPADPQTLRARLDRRDPELEALILARPGDKNFIQPDPTLQVPFDFFGYRATGVRSVRYDGPWIYAHDMDRSARSAGLKIIPRDWVEQHGRDALNHLQFLRKANTCRALFAN